MASTSSDEESEVKQAADMLMKAVQNFTGATAGRSGRYGVSDNSSPGRRHRRRRKRLRIQCDDENPYNDAQPGPSGARFGVMTQSGHSSPARSSQPAALRDSFTSYFNERGS